MANRHTSNNFSHQLSTLIDCLDHVPTLLLHACCAPCSSAVLEYLSQYFSIFLLYYNPNISPENEYQRRLAELQRLISQMPFNNPVHLIPCKYDSQAFRQIAQGQEQEPEGGARCHLCFRLRLEEAARTAQAHGLEYFTTTLTISPLKDAALINRIGNELEKKYGVKHLPADFKKKDGYKRSLALSREYELYRQDYCGCVYSKAEREQKKAEVPNGKDDF